MLQAIVFGAIQGLTEFLPVSSSGHLLIAHELFDFNTGNDLFFDVMLHLATALAVIIYFRKDIWEVVKQFFVPSDGGAGRKWGIAIILGTIPAGICGLLFQDQIETIFRNVKLVAIALIAGSILMYTADLFWRKRQNFEHINFGKGLIIGCFQALALIPGISRSGSTISGSLFSKLNREEAIRFSFLLSTPIIFGSALKELLDIHSSFTQVFNTSLTAGFVASFVFGLVAIHFMMKYLRTHTFSVFIWYRIILAVLVLILI